MPCQEAGQGKTQNKWSLSLFSHEMKYGKNKDKINNDLIEKIGIFVSEFAGSFAGWYCLFLLAIHWQNHTDLGSFDIFLGTISVLCISGYSYKMVSNLGKD